MSDKSPIHFAFLDGSLRARIPLTPRQRGKMRLRRAAIRETARRGTPPMDKAGS